MTNETMKEFFGETARIKMDVMYKVLSGDDSRAHGLFMTGETINMHKRGFLLKVKHGVNPGDVFIIELYFQGKNRLIKSCAEVMEVKALDSGDTAAEMSYMIISEDDRVFVDDFIENALVRAV